MIRRKSFSVLLKIPYVKIQIFLDRSFTQATFYIEFIAKGIKWEEMALTGVKKIRDLFYSCLIPMRRKILHVQATSCFLLGKGSLFYFGGFVTPNKVERDLVYFFTEFFRGINDAADKDKF